jgi:hypothetical protein
VRGLGAIRRATLDRHSPQESAVSGTVHSSFEAAIPGLSDDHPADASRAHDEERGGCGGPMTRGQQRVTLTRLIPPA